MLPGLNFSISTSASASRRSSTSRPADFARSLAIGLPAGPVLYVDEAMAADHIAHRKMVTELGAYRGLGTPIKLSRTPGGARSAPPRFNEHGEAVLRARGFFVSEARITGDHEQPADARERGDDLLDHVVGEYSCSGSPLMLAKGRTAIDGLSGRSGPDLTCVGVEPAAVTTWYARGDVNRFER
jgi:hypothetical protein